jgi:hypothetical protein
LASAANSEWPEPRPTAARSACGHVSPAPDYACAYEQTYFTHTHTYQLAGQRARCRRASVAAQSSVRARCRRRRRDRARHCRIDARASRRPRTRRTLSSSTLNSACVVLSVSKNSSEPSTRRAQYRRSFSSSCLIGSTNRCRSTWPRGDRLSAVVASLASPAPAPAAAASSSGLNTYLGVMPSASSCLSTA